MPKKNTRPVRIKIIRRSLRPINRSMHILIEEKKLLSKYINDLEVGTYRVMQLVVGLKLTALFAKWSTAGSNKTHI